MSVKRSAAEAAASDGKNTPSAVAEEILKRKIEDIATVLATSDNGKSRLYDEILAMVERSLFRIALTRSNQVKSTAAAYLGINRNTFQKKLVRLGLDRDSP